MLDRSPLRHCFSLVVLPRLTFPQTTTDCPCTPRSSRHGELLLDEIAKGSKLREHAGGTDEKGGVMVDLSRALGGGSGTMRRGCLDVGWGVPAPGVSSSSVAGGAVQLHRRLH